MKVSCQLHAPYRFTPGTHWIGGGDGPKARLETAKMRKMSRLGRKSKPDSSLIQPSHYADCTVPDSGMTLRGISAGNVK
jgi:hypothetical protein